APGSVLNQRRPSCTRSHSRRYRPGCRGGLTRASTTARAPGSTRDANGVRAPSNVTKRSPSAGRQWYEKTIGDASYESHGSRPALLTVTGTTAFLPVCRTSEAGASIVAWYHDACPSVV